MNEASTPRPLAGIRVLDLTQMAAGPFATMLFADAGAEVIKIERPGSGEPMRGFGPFLPADTERVAGGGILRHSRNKQSLTLNLAAPEGRAIFEELVTLSDVVWENFAPGTMARLGVGYERLRKLNPRLVYAAISGFGQTDILRSPFWQRLAYDPIAQALGGMMEVTGQAGGPPTMVGVIVGDLIPAVFCAYGVLLALRARELTGRGQLVDVAMVDSIVTLCEKVLMTQTLTGESTTRGGDNLTAPYGVFPCRDGHVVIAAAMPAAWQRFCQVMGREDLLTDPRTATSIDRARNFETFLNPIICEWLKDKTKAEVDELLVAGGVPGAPVLTVAEVAESPHVAARHMLLELDHPAIGTYRVAGNPVKLSEHPDPPLSPAPLLGQQTDEVLRGLLGYGEDRLASLREKGVI